nr:uncharacterized protein LOC117274729 [Nicotiana tomentosiformis]
MAREITFALLGYQNMMVYGIEVVISTEVEIPSLIVIQEAKLDDAEWIRVRQEQLILIDEKRMYAVCHGQLCQNSMANAFNKRVKPRHFIPGQLDIPSQRRSQRKVRTELVRSLRGPLSVVGRSYDLGRDGRESQHEGNPRGIRRQPT